MKTRIIQPIKPTLAALAAAVGLLASSSAHALPVNTAFVRGGNWGQDANQAPDKILYLAGITSSTTPAQAIQIADMIANDYHSVGLNYIRYAFDPPDVTNNAAWAVTTNCINELLADGLMVNLVCYACNHTNHKIDNMTTFWSAWSSMNNLYGSNTGIYTNIYFEPVNEPTGYTSSGLSNNAYYPFLHNHGITKVQDHIILDCSPPGGNYPVMKIGNMTAFKQCLLCVHDYDSGGDTSYLQWTNQMYQYCPGYRLRTIMNEFGATTDTGSDFLNSSSGQSNVTFVTALCDLTAAWPMGIAWYPSHMVTSEVNNHKMFNGSPGAAIVNRSLIDKLQNHWGFHTPLEAPGCDFHNFGQTDYCYYRPDLDNFGIKSGGGGHWGSPGDIAVPADYNGVGKVQMTTWNPSTRYWNIYPNMNVIQYGQPGDIPVPGDYRGIGSAQVAVWRPSDGKWVVNGKSTVVWGTNGDIPVPGYYNGDGHLDYATYRPSNGKFYVYQGAGPTFGQPGDVPVPGDYIGNGTTQFVLYRPGNSTWYLYSTNGITSVQFGNVGDIPVPGDYTGAGYTQLATWNPSTFVWNVDGVATNVTWGATNYIPLPLPYAIRHACYGYTE